jgi:hypothetical protein
MRKIPCDKVTAVLLAAAAIAASVEIYTPQNAPPVPALTDLPLQSSVTRHGITWTFGEPERVGRFVNGDYYVVGNVTVTAISPAPAPGRNGSVLNIPMNSGISPFDDRTQAGRYDADIRADPPVSMVQGDALISSISVTTVGELPAPLRPQDASISPVRTVSVLTCLSAPVAPDAFRPSYAGENSPIYYSRNLRRGLLPKLARVTGTPDLSAWAAMYERPWLDVCFFGFDAAIEYQPHYGREVGFASGRTALLLCVDNPDTARENLLLGFVQRGVDLWGLANAGYTGWPAHGGHGSGRKLPIVFAGLLLGETDMAAPSTSNAALRFGEDMQTMYDSCWTGADVVYAGHQGVWNGQPVNTSDPEWQPYEHLQPAQWPGSLGEDYRRCCTSIAWIAQGLAMRILRAESLWDHNAFFDYVDRWMTEEDSQFVRIILQDFGKDYSASWAAQGQAWDTFTEEMWRAYRNNLPAVERGPAPGKGRRASGITLRVCPNPASRAPEIVFSLSRQGAITLNIFSPDGREVHSPVSGVYGRGLHALTWDARSLPSGVYLVRLAAGGAALSRKFLLMR